MINIIKKDLRACFMTDTKTIIKLVVGLFIFSSILMGLSSVAIPLFLSYIFIFRSFYLDEANNCEYFFNSMPIDKEDIVYSKYIVSTLIIVLSILFTYFYSKILKHIFYIDLMYTQTMLSILNILLILVSVSFPIMFKYGYKKSYIPINLVMGIILVSSLYITLKPRADIHIEGQENLIISDPKLLIISGVCIVIYIISMYISTKIYNKKEVAL